MATVGRHKAVVELGKFHSQGFFAWVLWLVVHPPLYPWRREQGNGNAQLALEVRKL